MEPSRLTRTLCDVVLVLVAKLWREGNWILESLRWKGIRYFWTSQSSRCRIEWEYLWTIYAYREILQRRSLICHRLLCQNESRLPPYPSSEQVHRGGGLGRTWLILIIGRPILSIVSRAPDRPGSHPFLCCIPLPHGQMSASKPASIASYHRDGVTPSKSPSIPLRHELSRPTSSASAHRPSSRAASRPLSSASVRPTSRAGHGSSKFSQRLPSRQMSRIISLSHTLVSQTTSLQPEDDDGEFRALVDVVTRSLDYNVKAAPSSSMNDVTKQLHGSVFPLYLPLATELVQSYRKSANHLTGLLG
jgi:hypothetical protein